MSRPSKRGLAAGVFTAALAAALPLHAQAQSMGDGLKWEAALYGWFPAISGSTSFPPDGGGPSIDVSSGDVIDALKFAFMGNVGVKMGQWGLWTDLVYADFGASKQGSRDIHIGGLPLPVEVQAALQLDIKSWIWTLAGTYQLTATPEHTADLLFGTRLLDMDQTLGYTLTGGGKLPIDRSGSARASISNWDAIIGVRGRAYLGDERRWFVPYYADIGTGNSKLTWQLNAGIGYKFDWGSVGATWRYLDYEFDSDKAVQSMSFSGPVVGVAFQW
jgi:hypothetical protein